MNNKIFSFIAIAIIGLAFASQTAAQNLQFIGDICYRNSSDPASKNPKCRLDVFYDADKTGAPTVVWFHGGGLTGGDKFVPEELKKSGIIVVAVRYRLLPDCKFDDCIDDAAAATAWVVRNISKYGGDPSRIFVSGHSAGGYLTSMIGLDKKWLAHYGVDADTLAGLIPFSGQAITHFARREQQGIPVLQATIDEYAPLTYVRNDCPPVLILSGDRELEMAGRYEEQAYFWRMMKLTGHKDVRILEMQGYSHGNMPTPGFPLLVEFINQHCK
jgi:Esterase/lipase